MIECKRNQFKLAEVEKKISDEGIGTAHRTQTPGSAWKDGLSIMGTLSASLIPISRSPFLPALFSSFPPLSPLSSFAFLVLMVVRKCQTIAPELRLSGSFWSQVCISSRGTLSGPAGTRQCTAEGRAGGKDEPEVLEEREQERGPVSLPDKEGETQNYIEI